MGNPSSKNSEVIIAQNGANEATTTTTLEKKIELYGIFIIIIVIVVILIPLLVGCRYCGRRAKKVMVKDIVSSLEMGQVKPQPQTTVPIQTY